MSFTRFKYFLKLYILSLIIIISVCGCSRTSYGLSKSNPTKINIWTYYDGAAGIAFEQLVAEFNSTVGKEQGIVVYCQNMESLDALSAKLEDAIIGKIGSDSIPNIIQCYPDSAIELNNCIGLVDLDDYILEGEKDLYVKSFLDAGSIYIGDEKEWLIFPVAKSTDLLIINETKWDEFALDTGVSTDSLSTWEGLLDTAMSYYEWSDGKAFLGFDNMANILLTASSQLGAEIFSVDADGVTLNFDSDIMYKLWEYFYIPYIKGYYSHEMSQSYESLKYGEVIATVTSSGNASYLSDTVSLSDSTSYEVEYSVLTLPYFNRTAPYAIQQGAGMAITKSDETHEYASVVFLGWITSEENNMQLCTASGYMPVTVEAISDDYITEYFDAHLVDSIIMDTLNCAITQNQKYIMYIPTGFSDNKNAWDILNNSLLELAINDRNLILCGDDINEYLSKEHFEQWYEDTYEALSIICNK